jgi:hypothetical protein
MGKNSGALKKEIISEVERESNVDDFDNLLADKIDSQSPIKTGLNESADRIEQLGTLAEHE